MPEFRPFPPIMSGPGSGNGFAGRAPPGLAGSRLAGPRQDSPDSDVLAFSDDEHSRGPPGTAVERVKAQSNVPTARRSSWLPEVGAKAVQRKFSIGATSIHSAGSQPQTPAADTDPSGRPLVPHLNFSSNIWGIDKRRDSIGHQEALTSPTTINYATAEERPSALPVQIPLNPTIKAYRSQSYSVGQQDPEQTPLPPAAGARLHSVAYPQGHVSNHPSRPSLGSVMEDEMTAGNPVEDASNLRKHAALSSSRIRSPFASQYSQSADFAVDDSEEGPPEGGDHSENTSPSTKRAQWSSSLGFGQIHEPSQSRRHSMHVPANVRAPANGQHMPMTSAPEVQKQLTQRLQSLALSSEVEYLSSRYPPANAAEYDRVHPAPNPAMAGVGVPYGFPHQPAAKKYYIVSFKCGRSDIFYIPVHMGLNVRAGEMVIVEGDRGQDLGSVVHCDVSEEQAKKLKREADHEHFKWLMMYSRYNSAARGGLGAMSVNPMAHESRAPEREPDFKPKMIKRLAHQHEINGLQEKEGLEARAKRTCAGKVSDHGLQMEILDAEYQLDYKKLTFYFYAETYVNFNDLVQDLFKQFKTRIWLAAINPAAFPVAPNIPSAVAPGVTQGSQAAAQQANTGMHGAAANARRAAGLSGAPEAGNRMWYPAAGDGRAGGFSPETAHSYFERNNVPPESASAMQPGDHHPNFKNQYPPAYPHPYAGWSTPFAPRYGTQVPGAPPAGVSHPQYGMEPFAHQLRNGADNRGEQQGFPTYPAQFGPIG